MARSTRLVLLIKNIYTLWGRIIKNTYTLWGRKVKKTTALHTSNWNHNTQGYKNKVKRITAAGKIDIEQRSFFTSKQTKTKNSTQQFFFLLIVIQFFCEIRLVSKRTASVLIDSRLLFLISLLPTRMPVLTAVSTLCGYVVAITFLLHLSWKRSLEK